MSRPGLAPLVVRLRRYRVLLPVGAVAVDPTQILLAGNVVISYDAQENLLGHTP